MKFSTILKTTLAGIAMTALFAGCSEKEFEEVTEISLARCLEPQNLSARVDVTTGDNVTFGWDVNKDADSYLLVIYTDEEMTTEYSSEIVDPAEVPYTLRLTADQKYWFKVQAASESREASVWAVYDGSVKTYAVKDNLYLEVKGRTATSVSLAWSNEVSDYKEVTKLEAVPVKGGSKVTKDLSDAEATAAAATVEGLAASTEYQITLFYMSASRGAVDTWTMAEQGAATRISTSDELKTAVIAGGEYFLAYSAEPYSMSTAKPAASLTLVGELGPDGEKPVVQGKVELTADLAEANAKLYFENVKFDGVAGSRIVEHTGGTPVVESVVFVNCEITNYLAGFFYGNNNDLVKIGELKFDTCDMYGIVGSGGDAVDIRKTTEIDKITFVNNTMYDGIRTLFRIDASDEIKIGTVDFENNTVKGISVIDDGNNRGIFAIRVPHKMILRNNLFLWEDGGKSGEDTDRCQLFQINSATYVDEITGSGNYAYAPGKDFFTKVPAASCGFTVMNVDPCYNSKGNFFQLAAQDLIEGQVGASKWWISYIEKPEDLTQNALTGPHTWNLQDASLFAGDIKNARVRDELMLVGTEATPLKADGGIAFQAASVLTKKGVPTEGYVSFKVTTAGSVDLLLSDPDKTGASVVVALYDDNGLSVQGGAVASAANPGVQKIVVPEVAGEGTVYLYSTGAVTLTKLAWSEDTLAGNKVLSAPKPVVEPVTLTEGDETAVTVTWEAVPNAASYVVVFNKRTQDPQTELSFTVAAEDIAALKAGLYNFTVQAFPREDDIYYVKSEQGSASVAIQPKASAGGETVEVDLVWDFSDAEWQAALAEVGAANTDITNWDLTLNGLLFHSGSKSKYNTTFIQFGGKSGDMDRYFQFTAPEQGTLKITVSNTGNSEDVKRTVEVKVGDDVQSQVGGAPSTAPATLEYSVMAGDVIITAPVNGLRFYKIEFHYSYTTGAATPVEYDWDFSAADWQEQFATYGAANTDITNWDLTYDGLTFHSGSKSKYNTTFIQFGGKSGDMDRYFQFTAPEQGTLKITVSNTGNSEDVKRTVEVKVGDDVQSQVGGAPSTAPATLEYSVMAGDVIITAPVNGLRFYKIYYTNQ